MTGKTSYCTNIHLGESWQEIFVAVRRHVPSIKQRVAPDASFPLGLPREINLEVETYPWTVLPAELRSETVTDSISREIEWVEHARRAP